MPPYSIEVQPDTDIWRKPNHNAFNAPTRTAPEHINKPLKSFQSAKVTFSFPGGLIQKFDQGGLFLHISHPSLECHSVDFNSPLSHDQHKKCKWIKTGIEYYNNVPHISTVCCDRFADWSVVPLDGLPDRTTIELERDEESTMWVYHVVEGVRKPLREVAWVFADQEDEQWLLSVGGMGARPAKTSGSGDQPLEVLIHEVDVTWK